MRKTVKVMVSKVMAKTLNEEFTKRGLKFCKFEYRECGCREYEIRVNMYPIQHMNDWIDSKSKFKYIVVWYNPNCYALPKYLTTRDLAKLFDKSDGTLDGFVNAVRNEVEI